MRVGVVGLGGTGSAALRFLAAAGHAATGFEQFQVGHDQGSSHGESRIVRYTYPDLLYTQMMGDAYPLWRSLEAAAGEELMVLCGGLLFGPAGHPRVDATEAVLRETGLLYERLSASDVRKRFPAIHLAEGERAIFQAESGFLRAGSCVRAHVRLAREHGAAVVEGAAVSAVEPRGAEVVVRDTAGGEWVFDRVVLSSGAWIDRFFPGVVLPLRVSRQEYAYLSIGCEPGQFQPGRFPVWIDAGERFYGFPADGRVEGVKLAANHPGETVDPDRVRRTVDEPYLEKVYDYAGRRFPELGSPAAVAGTCLYTNTPDEHFVIDRVPGTENIWLVSGCSGHGFKFTVLLGRIAAELATDGSYPRDLSRFSLRRFLDE